MKDEREPERGAERKLERKQERKNRRYRSRRLQQYFPWLLLLLGVDGFSALLLWLADAEAFRALFGAVFLASVLLFALVCGVLTFREGRRQQAFLAFLDMPDEYHEEMLLKQVNAAQAYFVRRLAAMFREQQSACSGLLDRLADYEEYVESWAHEAKIPLSLLTLLLDNRRDELPDAVGFKLDYIRSRLQEYTDQILYYARIKGMRKDYLFEHIDVGACVGEVLEDYQPLLEEKGFAVTVLDEENYVYTDQRGLRFLLAQIVSNAIKYCQKKPEIVFSFERGEQESVLRIRDNGIGVKNCDLPFIFEKGFTGDCGSDRKKATGMGLYLAKEMARELHITLSVVSEWGKGFEMQIAFPEVTRVGELYNSSPV